MTSASESGRPAVTVRSTGSYSSAPVAVAAASPGICPPTLSRSAAHLLRAPPGGPGTGSPIGRTAPAGVRPGRAPSDDPEHLGERVRDDQLRGDAALGAELVDGLPAAAERVVVVDDHRT